MTLNVRKALLGCSAAIMGLSLASQTLAQQRTFDIPAQDAATAIGQYGLQAGVQITAPSDQLRGVRTRPLRGAMDARRALSILLQGTGLEIASDNGSVIVLRKAGGPPDDAALNSGATQVEEVVVTGTRIRGANTPSPIITLGGEQIREEGFRDLGEVIRSIPQNFSGGQNPGVALGATLGGVSNANATSGSALNLRGLGPDATVTLLNGRRLSYSGFVNAVDISVIPIAALDRLEIITDGSSAIYGSDAVGGVGNIITRRDFDGVRADLHIGTTTQGGGEERRYGLAAGKTWRTGGVLVAYDRLDVDALYSHQRDYLSYMPGTNSLVPSINQQNVFANLRQGLGANVSFALDGLYSFRKSVTQITQTPLVISNRTRSENFMLAPSVEFRLPGDWSATLGGSYGRDETLYATDYATVAGAPAGPTQAGCYCNETMTVELGGEGPLWTLPAGEIRTALGIGYRENDFLSRNDNAPNSSIAGQRGSHFAYGEVLVPLLSPEFGGQRLEFTGAVRYENYDDFGDVTTPKLGLLYQPTPDFTLKTSWGESYKAPTLIQQHQAATVMLQPAVRLGATGYPSDATALMVSGGNPDLKPETAETWTASVLFHPRAMSGLQLEVSAFDVDYTDRVLEPVSNRTIAFRDPVYAPFLVLDPSPALQAEVIARSRTGLRNATTAPYDPAKVMGVLYNQYTNVARQRLRGVDIASRYGFELGRGRASVQGSASWLESRQQNSPVGVEYETSGLVFNPPKFRARAGVSWGDDSVHLSSFVNHVDGVTNNQGATPQQIGSFTTVDLNARYVFNGGGLLDGVEIGLGVQNLFDRDPPYMTPMFDFMVSYDSTNYSGAGRTVRFYLSKQW